MVSNYKTAFMCSATACIFQHVHVQSVCKYGTVSPRLCVQHKHDLMPGALSLHSSNTATFIKITATSAYLDLLQGEDDVCMISAAYKKVLTTAALHVPLPKRHGNVGLAE